jgi:predicted nucleic acid-binding Zn ribbon protein
MEIFLNDNVLKLISFIMFRRRPLEVEALVRQILRTNGLETPLLQRRLIQAWGGVAGHIAEQYTEEVQIKNQTLWIKILNPAVRADLQMRRTELIAQLNNIVGAQIITDLRLF